MAIVQPYAPAIPLNDRSRKQLIQQCIVLSQSVLGMRDRAALLEHVVVALAEDREHVVRDIIAARSAETTTREELLALLDGIVARARTADQEIAGGGIRHVVRLPGGAAMNVDLVPVEPASAEVTPAPSDS